MANAKLVNVKKVYSGDVVAVQDFNIEIQDKEFIILVGPSGCGKSTTLRMIAGLEEITEGDLYIDGVRMNDVPPKDRDIAMVFQNYALYPHMSVAENMGFALKLRKLPKEEIKARVQNAAEILGIEPLLERKPKALSGGQRQRVALGRAIVRDPKLFLLDEPLSNLDAKLRVQMRTEIIKLYQRLNTTFIYVTHDQTEAMTMGTRIVVMKDGFIQQIAPPQELYAHPVNLFVATFIGSPQMNIVKATLQKEGDTFSIHAGDAVVQIPGDVAQKDTLEQYAGKEIRFGVRPEHVFIDPAKIKDSPTSCVSAYIDVVERMGSESFLYIKLDGQDMTVKVSAACDAEHGQTATFCIDNREIYIFDKDTEQTVFYSGK